MDFIFLLSKKGILTKMNRRLLKKILILLLFTFIFILPTYHAYASNSKTEALNLYSEAAVLIDAKTGSILYSKDSDKKMYPASTTKILTAIIALEKCNLNDMVTVSKSAVLAIPSGYSSAYLSEGEQISVRDLLSVFLVHSANDAGYVLAEYISGSIEEFAVLMNEKALEIGCTNTHFTNPSGIHDENHYTTAYDLSLIAKYCMENSTFRNYVSLKTCTINSTNKSDSRTYANTNDLLNPSSKYYLENCTGIKTGYTSEAKNCLISSYSKDDLELICVVLGADQTENGDSARYVDSISLFDYGVSHFSVKTFAQKNDIMESIQIANGTKDTRNLDLILQDSLSGLIKNDSEIPNPTIVLNENLSAPIAKNSVVGTITYTIDDVSYTQNLLASHDVTEDSFLIFIFKIILGIIIVFILIQIIFSKTKKKKKRKHKYNRHY